MSLFGKIFYLREKTPLAPLAPLLLIFVLQLIIIPHLSMVYKESKLTCSLPGFFEYDSTVVPRIVNQTVELVLLVQ